jgi:hypothetical protein
MNEACKWEGSKNHVVHHAMTEGRVLYERA